MSVEVQTKDDYTALIAELVGARICHDLISPIGALGNGIELLQMSAPNSAPEMDLLKDSVRCANARLQLFRLAFGDVGTAPFRGSDFYQMLSDAGANSRIQYDWQGPDVAPKDEFKLAALAVMCLEAAVPFGGTLRITSTTPHASTPRISWQLTAQSDRLAWDQDRWGTLLTGATVPDIYLTGADVRSLHPPATPMEVAARDVQFALFARALSHTDRPLTIEVAENSVAIQF